MDHLNLHPSPAFTLLRKARLEVAHYLNTYFSLNRRNSAFGPARPTTLNLTIKSTYLGSLSVFSGPSHFFTGDTTHGCFGAS